MIPLADGTGKSEGSSAHVNVDESRTTCDGDITGITGDGVGAGVASVTGDGVGAGVGKGVGLGVGAGVGLGVG